MTRKIQSFDAFGLVAPHWCGSVDSLRRIPLGDSEAQTPAQALIRIGRLVQFLVRHGVDDNEVYSKLGVDDQLSEFATAFMQAPDWLKLRALVEDWSVAEISRSIEAFGSASRHGQTAERGSQP